MSKKPVRAAPASPPKGAPAEETPDVVFVAGPTQDGGGQHVLRAREGRVEVGEIRPLAEGRPLQGEVVRLVPRPEHPRLHDVKTELKLPAPPAEEAPAARHGPAQVATPAFRDNWDATFGRRPRTKPSALN